MSAVFMHSKVLFLYSGKQDIQPGFHSRRGDFSSTSWRGDNLNTLFGILCEEDLSLLPPLIYLFIQSFNLQYIWYNVICFLLSGVALRVLSSWLLCLFALISSFMFFCFFQQVLNFWHYVIPVSALDSAISPRSPVPFTEYWYLETRSGHGCAIAAEL